MTMLTFTHGPLEPARPASTKPDASETAAAGARLTNIRQFCVCALTVLLAMAAVAGVIALKAAVYLSRLNFHP